MCVYKIKLYISTIICGRWTCLWPFSMCFKMLEYILISIMEEFSEVPRKCIYGKGKAFHKTNMFSMLLGSGRNHSSNFCEIRSWNTFISYRYTGKYFAKEGGVKIHIHIYFLKLLLPFFEKMDKKR